MTLWVDAQLSPALAMWIANRFDVVATPVSAIGLRDATDEEIFDEGRRARAVVMTKDADFVRLVEQRGPPPQILWVTVGNTSNLRMKEVLAETLLPALDLLRSGEPLVEIQDMA